MARLLFPDAVESPPSDVEALWKQYAAHAQKQVELDQQASHSLSHSINQSLTHSLNHLLTHLLTHSLTHLLTHSLTHSLNVSQSVILHLDRSSLFPSLSHSLSPFSIVCLWFLAPLMSSLPTPLY